MIPQRRLATLLHQAREYQHSRCVYHNSPLESSTFSLYTDHHCNKSAFPNTTTIILQGHTDEVWNMQWSHDGTYLATCGKDKTAIIWKAGVRYCFSCFGVSLVADLLLFWIDFHRNWRSDTGMVDTPDTAGSSVSRRVSRMVAGRFNTPNECRTSYQDVERSG